MRMKIHYYDGGVLECSRILVDDKNLIADDVYIVPLIEVLRIEDEEGGKNETE